jgi:CheY-like chemotaxis protein
VETYSIDIPGAVADGRLHLVERATTAQQTTATGQQVTQQQVEQANPGDPGSGLQVTTVTIDTVRPGASGAAATRTIQARDANGSFPVISVDTTKSDNIHAVQVQIAPSDPPKKDSK